MPRERLDYVVAHELAHLHKSTHNARFVALLNQHLPKWRTLRDTLNEMPIEGDLILMRLANLLKTNAPSIK